MANPQIKIKRSSVAGKIPTEDQLPLGELALNTYDGRVFASKNVGIGTTVFAVNPWVVGVGTNVYNAYFTEGNIGIGNTLPTSTLSVTGTGSFTGIVTALTFSGQVNAGVGTVTDLLGTNLNYSGVGTVGSLNIGVTQVISSARQLQNIASLDATTTATIESAIANAPNTFTDLNVTGITTLSGGVNAAQGADLARLRVTGITTLGQTNTTGLSNAGVSTLGNAIASTLNISGVSTLSTISLSAADVTTFTTTTITTTATAIVSISTSIYRSAVFQIQAVEGTNYNMTTINVLHDGIETYMTEYGTINQPIGIATFGTDISGGSLRLLAHPASINSTTFKVAVTALDI